MNGGDEWRPVPGFEGWYDVSDTGRVRSLPRTVHVRQRLRNGMVATVAKRLRGQMLRPGIASNGYATVSLRGDTFCVHALVAAAFMGPKPEDTEVCHNNGDKTDCRVSNLRYDTRRENGVDMDAHGTRVRGERYPNAKLNTHAAREIRRLRYSVTQAELARMFDVSPSAVQAVHDGRTWRHV